MLPKLRVARPTNNLAALCHFCIKALDLNELYTFASHDGFDGLMVGQPQAPYHPEFTQQASHVVLPAPTVENLRVFYLPEHAAVARMQTHGYPAVPAHNAYWDIEGVTFADPNGYRVVLQNAAWTL